MTYPLFEFLALTVGSVSILASVVATLWAGSVVEEVIAQGLLLLVLVGAVHRGRNGGAAAAILAILTYLGMRVPMITRDGFSSDVVALLLTRTLTYAALGIGGGILVGRIQYFFARFESSSNIDAETGLFNRRHVARTLRAMIGQYEGFGKPFSVVILSLTDAAAGAPSFRGRRALRSVATYLRDHVRLIDDVARLDDGRFVLVLPQTGMSGAGVAAARLGNGVRRLLGARDESVGIEVLSAETDLGPIRELCGLPPAEPAAPESIRAAA